MRSVSFVICLILMLGGLCLAQNSNALTTPYNAAFKGTYTFGLASPRTFTIQYNMKGQQVGFCNGGQLPYQYRCSQAFGQDVITGTLVADGAGHLLTGSKFSFTADPNAYQCSSKNNATPDCPYKVPSGIAFSSSTKYVVGDEVDYGGQTFQAAIANTGVPPVVIINGSNPQQGNACAWNTYVGQGAPVCTWVVLYSSAAGKNGSGTGTLTGTYSIQANGIGAMTVTPSGSGSSPAGFALLVPPSVAGQQIQILAQPTLSNENRGSGTAILQ